MAALLNLELARLRTAANTAFVSGKFKTAIDCLDAMLMTAIHVLNESERKQLSDFENQFEPLLILYGHIGTWNKERLIAARKAEFALRKLYPKYNMIIMDFLDKYGFLGSRKQDASKMKR